LTIRPEHFFKRVHRLLRVENFSTFAFTATSILMSGGQRRLKNLAFAKKDYTKCQGGSQEARIG